jgi:hypothetical protein
MSTLTVQGIVRASLGELTAALGDPDWLESRLSWIAAPTLRLESPILADRDVPTGAMKNWRIMGEPAEALELARGLLCRYRLADRVLTVPEAKALLEAFQPRHPAPAPVTLPTLPATPAAAPRPASARRTVTGNRVGSCPVPNAVDVASMDDAQALTAAGMAWSAVRVPVRYDTAAHGTLTSRESFCWHRSDTGGELGVFGGRRQPRQPADYLQALRSFHSKAGDSLQGLYLGCQNGGKIITMAAKIADSGIQTVDLGDVTESWILLQDFYGQSLSPRLSTFSLELVCNNGMTKRVENNVIKLSHYGELGADSIRLLIESALEQNTQYQQVKRRLIETPLTIGQAESIITEIFGDEGRVANNIRRLYRYTLRGGNLDSRKDNAWRLMSAVTEYTSHQGNNPETRFLSQVAGSRNSLNQKMEARLLELAL